MAIFVSYSRVDADFVNVLATWLVKNNVNVWIDKWELNVGDSLINRIQNAIENAGALLVVLSKASVESEWCKKELNAGLERAGSANSDRVLSGDCVLPQPKMAEMRRADEKTSTQEPYSGLQGQGGFGRHQGRKDTFRVGRAI
jgi:hypothetical protein